MNVVIIEPPEKHWECPTCGHQHVTRELKPHTPMHFCPKLSGVYAPYVQVFGDELPKLSVRHVVVERGDYLGKEIAQKDRRGRPITAILTERADGSNDCHAFAGMATGDGTSQQK